MSKNTDFIKLIKKNFPAIAIQDMAEIKPFIRLWGVFEVKNWDYKNVFLQDWIIYRNFSDGLILKIDGFEFRPELDRVYVFPPYTKFEGHLENSFFQFFVHFRINEPFDSVRPELFSFNAVCIDDELKKLFECSDRLKQSVYLNKILLTALQNVPQRLFLPSNKTEFDPRIRKILDSINKNPNGENSISTLCSSVKMSENNFHRCFRKVVGTTPKQYILKKRMEYARYLLMNSNSSIDEIAEKSGFSNRYHFSKAFKNYYSFPPISYRKFMKSNI